MAALSVWKSEPNPLQFLYARKHVGMGLNFPWEKISNSGPILEN